MNTPANPRPVLVIGWGSELRGDDAAGLVFARRLAAAAPAGVEVLDLPQLTPELAWDVSRAARVVFVDAFAPADRSEASPEPQLRRLSHAAEAGDSRMIPTCVHSLSPERVLELASLLYESEPEAWVLCLPVADLAIGIHLSATARDGIEAALRAVIPLLETPPPETLPAPPPRNESVAK